MSGQLHHRTILRALFAGGIAIQSRYIAKVRLVSEVERSQNPHRDARGEPINTAIPRTVTSSRGSPSRPSVPPRRRLEEASRKSRLAAGAGAVGHSAVAAPKTDPQAEAK